MIDLILKADLHVCAQDLPVLERCKHAVNFVYLIQGHRFDGIDVVVWRELPAGEFDQYVAATGPILLGPVVHKSRCVAPLSEGQMSSKDRVRWRLRGVTPEIVKKSIERTAYLQVHNSASISESTFLEVCNIVGAVGRGCHQLLGSESAVRVVAQFHGTEIDANSWNGTDDPNVIFRGINKLLMIAGIENLPLQQIPIVVEE